jgi:hypothetical protein
MVRVMAPAVHQHPVLQLVRPTCFSLNDVVVVHVVDPHGDPTQAALAVLGAE